MADFYQSGVVTTLHNLRGDGVRRIESQLAEFRSKTSVALVLPALYSEFESPVMARIVDELSSVRYLRRIVLALGQASESQYHYARSFFRRFRTPVSVLQVDHPRVLGMLGALRETGLDPGLAGKGRACWLACGYVLAKGDCDVIALHDCDIKTYSRSMLARLCYPMMHPGLNFEFCKGYYARRSDRLHGRVTRLFLTPLVRALRSIAPEAKFLPFLDSFRYALAGEFSMRTRFARACRIPSDWGLEVGVLAEVHRECAISRVCQADLTDNYDHKHQALCSDDPNKGLRKMTTDIGSTLLRVLAAEGIVLGTDQLRTLHVTYARTAEEMIGRYEADALVNGLKFDRHSEEVAATAFRASLNDSVAQYLREPLGAPEIPSWARVQSAMPEFLTTLERVVTETDCADADRPVLVSCEPVPRRDAAALAVPLIASA